MDNELHEITLFDIKTKCSVIHEIEVVLDEETDQFIFCLQTENFQIKCQHYDYFPAFQIFRDALLRKGYGIKCKGSLINAVQSPMMSNTCKVYLVEMERQALLKDVVNI